MDIMQVRAAFVGTRSIDAAARRLGCSAEALMSFMDEMPDDEVMKIALMLEQTCETF